MGWNVRLDATETDKQYLSQVGPLISTLTCLGVEVLWETPEAASSGFSSCVRRLFPGWGGAGGRGGGVGCSGTGSSKSRAAINATHARSGSTSLVQLFSPSYTNIPAAEEQLVDQLAQTHNCASASSFFFIPRSWVPTAPNNSSGRSESIHTGKILNVCDPGWVTSCWWSLSGGRRRSLKECFTTVQKYILSSAFIWCELTARRLHAETGGEGGSHVGWSSTAGYTVWH